MIYHKSKQVGFIEHGEANIDKIMHNGECVFNQGFDRDTSGTDSVTLEGTIGKDLMDWSIVGNTVQNGTPSPENPVSVLGVGDYDASTGMYKIPVVSRGKNLCPGFISGIAISATTGEEGHNEKYATTDYIKADFIEGSTRLNFSGLNGQYSSFTAAYNINKEYLGRTGALRREKGYLTNASFPNFPSTVADRKIAYIRMTQYTFTDTEREKPKEAMFSIETYNEYPPYTPYRPPVTTTQYLPTPLMANERLTPTAREVKWGKYECTGNEYWRGHSTLANWYQFQDNNTFKCNPLDVIAFCSHYKWSTEPSNMNIGYFTMRNPSAPTMRRIVLKADLDTVDEFKAFLKSEYDAGHPVTVWYLLATPTSEPVTTNPIGTLRNEEKTIKGTTTIITTDTEVLPTQIEASYKSNKADYVVVNFATTDGNIFTTTDGDTYTIKMRKSQYDTMMTNELLNLLEVM